MIKTPLTKGKQGRKKFILAHYGLMKQLVWFDYPETTVSKLPCSIVVKTDRGLEIAKIVGRHGCYKAGQFRWSIEEIKEYFDNSQVLFADTPAGKFVRIATQEDLSEEKHLADIVKDKIKRCKDLIAELNLPMKIICAEHIFGGERIIFYFMSDGRVDFRELVKKLAHEYQTRIEMFQIGARDEAKLLGDYETCGQQCCCIMFLKALKPVNMRMAKVQKATLDPAKISGYCGRLKCCLRYEDKTYTDLKRFLPRKNALVKTPEGEARVIDVQILTQLVIVMTNDGKRLVYPLEELENLPGSQQQLPDAGTEPDTGEDSDNFENFERSSPQDKSPADTELENDTFDNDEDEISNDEDETKDSQ